jgi:DNA helicase-2/ATP-dependent DNA helicase PcrA
MYALSETLNDRQRAAVEHEGGHLLVIAGAGSGKTKTLATRVAGLIAKGVPPGRILLLTFTRRASQEMISRAGQLVEPAAAAQVWGGTFHSIGNRLLRRFAKPLGLDPGFTVLDQPDTADLIDLVRDDLGLGRGDRRFPRKATLADIYTRTVNTQARLQDVLDKSFPWCAKDADGIRSVFEAYTERKRAHDVLDYDDLLLFWLAATHSPIGSHLGGLFDHVLVDEYQDSNALQDGIVRGMCGGATAVTAVGDDAQAIYSFRSATARNILDFSERFENTTLVTLEENYRSTTAILDLSNAVMDEAAERFTKNLWSRRGAGRRPELVTCEDESAQSHAVCERVLEGLERGIQLQRQAVLIRTGHHSDVLELELTRRNIPFVKYGGLKFLESAHVKDLLALLRVLENEADEVAWFRVLKLVEGVGAATARRVMSELAMDGAILRLRDEPPRLPGDAAAGVHALAEALADCLEPGLPVAAQIDRLKRFLEPVFARLYKSAASRLSDLDRLAEASMSFPTRARFLSELTIDPASMTSDLAGPPLLEEDYLVLSTIHSAKGCEWDVVHVIHAADGMIPSDMATGDHEQIEEERRLLYVAMTRARDMLHIYHPLRYYIRKAPGRDDPYGYTQLTRFLTPRAVELMDVSTCGCTESELPEVSTSAKAEVDAFLSRLFN